MINTMTGFHIGSKDIIDSRIVLSLEEMRKVNENVMPDVYFTICKNNGQLYLFNKENTVDAVSGKFRILEGNVIAVPAMPDPSSEYEGKVLVYTGESDGTYIKGSMYKLGEAIPEAEEANIVDVLADAGGANGVAEQQYTIPIPETVINGITHDRVVVSVYNGKRFIATDSGTYTNSAEYGAATVLYPDTPWNTEMSWEVGDEVTIYDFYGEYYGIASVVKDAKGTKYESWESLNEASENNLIISSTVPESSELDLAWLCTADILDGEIKYFANTLYRPHEYEDVVYWIPVSNELGVIKAGDCHSTSLNLIGNYVTHNGYTDDLFINGVTYKYNGNNANYISAIIDSLRDPSIVLTGKEGDTYYSIYYADDMIHKNEDTNITSDWEVFNENGILLEDVTANVSIGGITESTTVARGTKFTEFVKQLLVKYINPSIKFKYDNKTGTILIPYTDTSDITISFDNATIDLGSFSGELPEEITAVSGTTMYTVSRSQPASIERPAVNTEISVHLEMTLDDVVTSNIIVFKTIYPVYFGKSSTITPDNYTEIDVSTENLTTDYVDLISGSSYKISEKDINNQFVVLAIPGKVSISEVLQDMGALMEVTGDWIVKEGSLILPEVASPVPYTLVITDSELTMDECEFTMTLA